ncbi:MAG TPA: hypothetical protein VFT51_05750 [Bacillales bacterium]|nr:hypothetical protein [Bacillales bacterium]
MFARTGTTTIDYVMDFHNKKDVTISVEWLDGVKVKGPKWIEHEKLITVLHEKAPWILEKWREFNEMAHLRYQDHSDASSVQSYPTTSTAKNGFGSMGLG